MAVEIKPIIVGSKKATAGVLAGGIGFAVFVVCFKWLGLSLKEALAVAGFVAGLSGGGYNVLEGIRDIVGKGK